MSHILWKAKDEENTEVQLTASFDIDQNKERWTLELTEGRFSGYPAIWLGRDDMQALYVAIKKELGVSGG